MGFINDGIKVDKWSSTMVLKDPAAHEVGFPLHIAAMLKWIRDRSVLEDAF